VVGSTKPLRCFAYFSTLTVIHVVALHRNKCVQTRLLFLLSHDMFVCDTPERIVLVLFKLKEKMRQRGKGDNDLNKILKIA
jgi:hypothetical protein